MAGLITSFYIFGNGAFLGLLSNLFCYILFQMLPSQYLDTCIFGISGLVLAFAQLHKQIYYPGTSGITLCMPFMFAYCKNTSLAANIKDYETIKKAQKKGEKPDVKPREMLFALDERPSFFDYMSYIYFSISSICGPWIEYKDLMEFFKAKNNYKDIHSKRSFFPAILLFVSAISCIIYGNYMSKIFGADLSYIITDEFAQETFLYKV